VNSRTRTDPRGRAYTPEKRRGKRFATCQGQKIKRSQKSERKKKVQKRPAPATGKNKCRERGREGEKNIREEIVKKKGKETSEKRLRFPQTL